MITRVRFEATGLTKSDVSAELEKTRENFVRVFSPDAEWEIFDDVTWAIKRPRFHDPNHPTKQKIVGYGGRLVIRRKPDADS